MKDSANYILHFTLLILGITLSIVLLVEFLSDLYEPPPGTSPARPANTEGPARPAFLAAAQAPIAGTVKAAAGVALPSFPWPPPGYSAFASLTLGSLERSVGNDLLFGDVDGRIRSAFSRAGYEQRSYFTVPDGFAIVTGLEQIDEDGYPVSAGRWPSFGEPVRFTQFSPAEYLDALSGAPEGRYRVFAFVVTSTPAGDSGTPVARDTARIWSVDDAKRLPYELASRPYTDKHVTTVYIYEFVRPGVGAAAIPMLPGRLTGRQHLERAALWEILNADCPPDPDRVTIAFGYVVRGAFCLLEDLEDVYEFSGTSGDRIRIQLETPDEPVPCVWLVPGQNGTVLHECQDEINTTLDQTGMYALWVDDRIRDNLSTYTLVVKRLP